MRKLFLLIARFIRTAARPDASGQFDGLAVELASVR